MRRCPWCGDEDRFHDPTSTCTGLELDGLAPIARAYARLADLTDPADFATHHELLVQVAGDRRLPGWLGMLLAAEIHEHRRPDAT